MSGIRSEKVDKLRKTAESRNIWNTEKGWGKGARVAPKDDFSFCWLKSRDIFNRSVIYEPFFTQEY